MLVGFLVSTSLASFVAVLQVVGVVPTQLWNADDVSSLGRPTGLYPEPDWLGMFSGLGLIVGWRMLTSSRLRYVLTILNGSAFVLAFARAAWLALVVSVGLVALLKFLGKAEASRRPRAIGLFAAVGLTLVAPVIVSPQMRQDLTLRVVRALDSDQRDVSATARVQQMTSLQELASTAPWHGHGLSASGRVQVSGRIEYGHSQANVSSNWVLGLWVDGALLAVPLMALLAFAAIFSGASTSGQMLTFLLVNNLFSNATFMPVTWFLTALVLSTAKNAAPGISPSDRIVTGRRLLSMSTCSSVIQVTDA